LITRGTRGQHSMRASSKGAGRAGQGRAGQGPRTWENSFGEHDVERFLVLGASLAVLDRSAAQRRCWSRRAWRSAWRTPAQGRANHNSNPKPAKSGNAVSKRAPRHHAAARTYQVRIPPKGRRARGGRGECGGVGELVGCGSPIVWDPTEWLGIGANALRWGRSRPVGGLLCSVRGAAVRHLVGGAGCARRAREGLCAGKRWWEDPRGTMLGRAWLWPVGAVAPGGRVALLCAWRCCAALGGRGRMRA
jgi:hypothetical protein